MKNSDIHDKLSRQTVIGFFYDGWSEKRHFTNFTGVLPCFNFLPFYTKNVAVSDCCNGLILCYCSVPVGFCFWVVCNPITRNYRVLSKSPHEDNLDFGEPATPGEAQLCFDPIVSSHFHVVDFVKLQDGRCASVQIYSSETDTWIYKECEWAHPVYLDRHGPQSVFLIGFLHNMGTLFDPERRPVIIAVDMEGNTSTEIAMPTDQFMCGYGHPTLHQAQGHLCACLVDSVDNQFIFSMWILEGYGTNNWTLKHTVNLQELFESFNIRVCCKPMVITVHPEWNLVFFAGHERKKIIAYDMDRRKGRVITARLFRYSTRWVKYEGFARRTKYLLYTPLLFDSIEKEEQVVPLQHHPPRVWNWNRPTSEDADEDHSTDDATSSDWTGYSLSSDSDEE